MLVDTHTHLYLEEFQPTPEDAVCRAIDTGVGLMVFPNVDLNTIEPMKRLCSQFPENIVMAIGLHPTEVIAFVFAISRKHRYGHWIASDRGQ